MWDHPSSGYKMLIAFIKKIEQKHSISAHLVTKYEVEANNRLPLLISHLSFEGGR